MLQTSVSEGNETLHHLITGLDLEYLSQDEFDNLVAQLERVRQKVYNLLLRIRRRH